VFDKNIPIYIQLLEHFKTNIVTGVWVSGAYIQSVRELALMYQVNPNTVMKTLNELELMGLLETDRTVGKRVTSNLEVIEHTKLLMVNQIVQSCLEQFKNLGVSKEKLIEIIKEREHHYDPN
jgi:GntR family transcriptional regulator